VGPGNRPLFDLMKVLATRNVIAAGEALEEGKVYDLAEEIAGILIRMGKATEAPAEAPKPKAARKPKAEASDGDQ
jgi:hypothetical protein